MAVSEVAPAPFPDTNGLAKLTESLTLPKTMLFMAQLSAFVTSYHTRLQQWICESLMFLWFNHRLGQAYTTQKARRAKLININSPRAAKVYFVIVWKKF